MGTLALEAYAVSDPGRLRDHNEDACYCATSDPPEACSLGRLFLVADGMGGHQAGEVASQGAASRVSSLFSASAEADPHLALEAAVQQANRELYSQAQADPAQQGMGTTLTAAAVLGNHLYVAHVGDSRLYLMRGGALQQMTHDHSWVEQQVQAGVLTRQQAEHHPQRNVIARALGTSAEVVVDHLDCELADGDTVLLCSDGLNGELSDAQIGSLLVLAGNAQAVAEALCQAALAAGGRDNVTAIVVRVGRLSALGAVRARPAGSGLLTTAFVIVLLALLLAGTLLLLNLLRG